MSNYKFNDYWAVTMFSFTNELLAAEKTPLELIEDLLEAGVTSAVEIDGPQHFRNFPHPPEAEISALEKLLAKHQAKLSLLGGAVDRAKSADRTWSSTEVVEAVAAQIRLAGRLGAYGLRLMVGSLEAPELAQLAKVAEAEKVQILYELHGVMAAESKTARDCLELVRSVDSPFVGLMLDTSLFMTEFPQVLRSALTRAGVEDVERLATQWKNSEPMDLPPRLGAFRPTLTSRMGHSKPSDYDEYVPYLRSVHMKYWDLEEVNRDEELLRYLFAHDYRGYLTSEWGGHEWESKDSVSAFATTKAHKVLVERAFDLAH